MHRIQVDIFKNVIEVCEKLGLKYFLVHGSLLGAITSNHFMPLDDDIDIAMPRKDYEVFLSKGNGLINPKYFIQSSKTDKNYPIDFAKVRDCDTTYIADILKNIDMNHGIFIDVFPIDFCSDNRFKRKFNDLKFKLLNIRISEVFDVEHISTKTKILRLLAKLIHPSFYKALEKREALCISVESGKHIQLTGGKSKEKGIPAEWFDEIQKATFEGVESCIPKKYHEYLTQIYGDYKNRTLLEDKEHDENNVEINACVLDSQKAYTHYFNRGL